MKQRRRYMPDHKEPVDSISRILRHNHFESRKIRLEAYVRHQLKKMVSNHSYSNEEIDKMIDSLVNDN